MTVNDDILKEARERYELACTVDRDEYEEALEDLRFSNGEGHWPDEIVKERSKQERPCLVINMLPKFHDKVAGDLRENRPGLKVKPVDGDSDPKKADFIEGLFRHIESVSNALISYTTSFEHTIDCGRGFFRIVTRYADDESFDQEIGIERIEDPGSVRWDPSSRGIAFEDADYVFVVKRMSKKKYEATYPGKPISDFSSDQIEHRDSWMTEDEIILVEYFRKVEDKEKSLTIYEVAGENGKRITVDTLAQGQEALRQRTVKKFKVERYLLSGAHVLEGPDVWPSQYFPIIPVWGKEKWYDGKRHLRGITRFAKDPQRMYNYWRTSETEAVALAPKNPFLVTPGMLNDGETDLSPVWNNFRRSSLEYLPYHPDSKAPMNMPKRSEPVPYYAGYATNAELSAREMMDTTGMPEATLGEASGERSGEAIKQRRMSGDRQNYTYTDNLARAIQHAGMVMLDLLPQIYDNERIVRILGPDMTEKYMTINSDVDLKSGEPLHDMMIDMQNIGKYDITVTVGPSNITRRLEAVDTMSQLMHDYPSSAAVIAPLVVKMMDVPNGEDFVDMLKALMPPEARAIMEAKSGGGQTDGSEANPMQPEMPQEPQIDPIAEIQVAQEQLKLEGLSIDNEIKREELAIKRAEAGLKAKQLNAPEPVKAGAVNAAP